MNTSQVSAAPAERNARNGPETLLSLNARALSLVEAAVAEAASLRILVTRGVRGERRVDVGARAPGSIEAGLRLAETCLAGLARVTLAPDPSTPRWPWRVVVRSSQPVLACLGAQYAGWKLEGDGFFGLGSGPARALARREPIIAELDHDETADDAVLAVEGERPPPGAVVDDIASACGVPPDRLTILFAPTRSLAGSVQVAARCLECALSKARLAGFPLPHILDGLASAPLPPPHPESSWAMGRTNDAIIFGGHVHLFVLGPAPEARRLAEHLPSGGSRDYGEPFRRVFERAGGDFYRIDPHLFSPAEVAVTSLEGGETYRAGALDPARLDASFD